MYPARSATTPQPHTYRIHLADRTPPASRPAGAIRMEYRIGCLPASQRLQRRGMSRSQRTPAWARQTDDMQRCRDADPDRQGPDRQGPDTLVLNSSRPSSIRSNAAGSRQQAGRQAGSRHSQFHTQISAISKCDSGQGTHHSLPTLLYNAHGTTRVRVHCTVGVGVCDSACSQVSGQGVDRKTHREP